MNKKTRKRVFGLALVAILGIVLIWQGASGGTQANEMALPTILYTGTPTEEAVRTETVTATPEPTVTPDTSNEWTVNDTTPNYDPNDPYGVKFGMAGMGIILLVILLQGIGGYIEDNWRKR